VTLPPAGGRAQCGTGEHLDLGLAVILVFIGAEFMLTDVLEIGVGVSLLVITVAIGASLLRSRRA
jgi:hypothetical protein